MRIPWFTRFVLIVLMLFSVPQAAAQGGETNITPGNTTIHVVQRGENLFRIAMQYGTTVEAVAAANGITDTRYITVGQRLLIPNAQINTPGAISTYTVEPGDSLATISRRYHTGINDLATTNRLTNPAMLFIGQQITINQGDTAAAAPEFLYHVQAGDNLYRVALKHSVSIEALLAANNLSLPAPMFPGQLLWVPGGDGSAAPSDLPPLYTACTLSPIPAIQGETISLHVSTSGPATLTGTFMNTPVQIVTQDVTQHYAVFGVHTFTAPGVYPMVLTATEPDNQQTALILRIMVNEGGYGSEVISLNTEQEELLKPDLTEPEWQKVATLMSGFTAQRYFDGLMGLPSSGAITSQFGTSRSYNDGVLNTFHSGTDFGSGPGSPILAPAAGVVVLAESLPVRGNTTIIDHGWGVYTGYWHQTDIYVNVGDIVMPGQTIGTVGSTGRVTGPHLHWEMWVGGVQVDPMQWVRQSFP